MSIMDFFRGNTGDTATAAGDSMASSNMGDSNPNGQPQQPPQGQPPTPTSGGQASGEGNEGEVSGLDAFKSLWDNSEEPKEGENSPDYDPSSGINVDPKAIQEAVAQIDFSQALDRDTLAQISEGGEGAQQAFAKSMNTIAQHVFSQSMIANATLVKQALAQSTSSFDSRAQELMRRTQAEQTLTSSNPALKHPSAKPIVDAMQSQLAKKFPQASSDEIAQKATQWFEEFANELGAPKRQAEQQQRTKNEPDWEAFFNS